MNTTKWRFGTSKNDKHPSHYLVRVSFDKCINVSEILAVAFKHIFLGNKSSVYQVVTRINCTKDFSVFSFFRATVGLFLHIPGPYQKVLFSNTNTLKFAYITHDDKKSKAHE